MKYYVILELRILSKGSNEHTNENINNLLITWIEHYTNFYETLQKVKYQN